jgi:hypothetical protein
MNHNTEQAEKHIDKDLHDHPNDFKPVYKELHDLRKKEGNEHFHQDLKEINDKLQKDGVLPHMKIVENGEDFAVADDRSDNPKHAAIVSRSNSAPKESTQESNTYKGMGYNGWKDSVSGGGGANGGLDTHAVSGNIPTGQQKALIDQALKLAVPGFENMTPAQQQALESAVNTIVQHESGWNPNAINLTDSNAAAGHPSQGLMQTIPGTFKQYALPGYNTNIDDPLSNLVAGIRYADSRYGSLQNVPGIRSLASGGAYQGY